MLIYYRTFMNLQYILELLIECFISSTILFIPVIIYIKIFKKNIEKKKLLFYFYIFFVVSGTLFRQDISDVYLFDGEINFNFLTYSLYLYKYNYSLFLYNVIGNIIWFLPLGIFVHSLYKSNIFKTFALAFVMSLTIETFQFVFSQGISDIDDLFFNCVGAIVGWIMYKLYSVIWNKDKS